MRRHSRSNLAMNAILNLYRWRDMSDAGNVMPSRIATHVSFFEVSCTTLKLRCRHVSRYLTHARLLTCTTSCEVTSLPQPVIRRTSRDRTVIAFQDCSVAILLSTFISFSLFSPTTMHRINKRNLDMIDIGNNAAY